MSFCKFVFGYLRCTEFPGRGILLFCCGEIQLFECHRAAIAQRAGSAIPVVGRFDGVEHGRKAKRRGYKIFRVNGFYIAPFRPEILARALSMTQSIKGRSWRNGQVFKLPETL